MMMPFGMAPWKTMGMRGMMGKNHQLVMIMNMKSPRVFHNISPYQQTYAQT
jgi:hypothetical protein